MGGHKDTMNENYLFVFANTMLPQLYFQNPRIVIRAKREALKFEAAVLTELVNTYFTDEIKQENQLAIIDALLPYGYGCVKNGYNSRTGIAKSNVLTGTRGGKNESNMEGNVEYLAFEKPIIVRQSPKRTFLDHTQPFGKGNRITFEYTRTLQQLMDSNLYKLSSNFINHFKSRADGNDARKVEIDLTEMWIMLNGKAWKLVYVPGWQEEIALGS